MNWDSKIKSLVKTATDNCNEFIEMIYIQSLSRLEVLSVDNNHTEVTEDLINKWLRKRGYSANTILKKHCMVKDFTCVNVTSNYIEIWHDIPNGKSSFITESYLTHLPIALNYMEKL